MYKITGFGCFDPTSFPTINVLLGTISSSRPPEGLHTTEGMNMEMKEIYTHMRQLNADECADRLAKLEADYRCGGGGKILAHAACSRPPRSRRMCFRGP